VSTKTEWATAYHETIADLRRELMESSAEYRQLVDRHRYEAHNELTGAARDAYVASLMASGYAYTLAALLERIGQTDPGNSRRLVAFADEILTNRGREGICADVWPQQEGTTSER
jgi:hypothetical protein